MSLAIDLMGVGVPAEEALRVGDSTGFQQGSVKAFGGSAISVATQIGTINGPTILELSPASSGSSVVFMGTVELDRIYTLLNTSSTLSLNVFPPTTVASFQGLANGASFSLGANKVAYVSRLGQMPPVVSGSTGSIGIGSVSADRWIYVLSN